MKSLFEDYDGFVDKFKPKLTTDDCYTPSWLYDVVIDFIGENVMPLDGLNIVRPFWPGEDYRSRQYQPTDVVIDNPPFSIGAQIVDYYLAHDIKFWLWAPHLTLGGLVKDRAGLTAVVCSAAVTYENGAQVNTSFTTNMFPDRRRIYVAGSLAKRIKEGDKRNKPNKELPKYDLPDGTVTSARLGKIATAGLDLIIGEDEAKFVPHLERMRAFKKKLYGGGWILSREAAAREAAAREAAAREAAAREAAAREAAARDVHIWEYSEAEKLLIEQLSKQQST